MLGKPIRSKQQQGRVSAALPGQQSQLALRRGRQRDSGKSGGDRSARHRHQTRRIAVRFKRRKACGAIIIAAEIAQRRAAQAHQPAPRLVERPAPARRRWCQQIGTQRGVNHHLIGPAIAQIMQYHAPAARHAQHVVRAQHHVARHGFAGRRNRELEIDRPGGKPAQPDDTVFGIALRRQRLPPGEAAQGIGNRRG